MFQYLWKTKSGKHMKSLVVVDGKAVGRVEKCWTLRVDFEPIATLQSYRLLRNWSLCVLWGKASWKISRWKMVFRDFGKEKISHISIKVSRSKTLKPNRIIFRWKSALRRNFPIGKQTQVLTFTRDSLFIQWKSLSKRRWLMRRNVVGRQLLTKALTVRERRSTLYWDICCDRNEWRVRFALPFRSWWYQCRIAPRETDRGSSGMCNRVSCFPKCSHWNLLSAVSNYGQRHRWS